MVADVFHDHPIVSTLLLVSALSFVLASTSHAQDAAPEELSDEEAAQGAPVQEMYPEEVTEAPTYDQEPFAQHDGNLDVPDGMEIFRQAQQRYDQGRYQEAVDLLLQLLELDPNAPDIYYNIALAYEHLTLYEEALRYLDRYRELDIGDEERDRVERMMVRIRGAQANAPPQPEPETHTRVVVQRFGRADAAFWAMVASTVLFAGGAAVTGGFALDWSRASEEFVLGPDGDQQEHQRWVNVATTLAIVTDVLIGVASATALTALLLYVLRTHEEEEQMLTPSLSSDTEGAQTDRNDTDARRTNRQHIAERRQRMIPRVQVGLGAFIMGWEL